MKKIAYLIGALAFAITATNALAQSRASLYLAGEIDLITNIFINPEIGTIDTLDVVGGEVARLVATVDEESNNAAGYRIDMESVNAGVLLHNDGTTSTAYTISYDGGATTAPGPVGTPVTVKTSGLLTGLTTDNSTVAIDVTPAPTAVAGAYTDTLIFTIVAL